MREMDNIIAWVEDHCGVGHDALRMGIYGKLVTLSSHTICKWQSIWDKPSWGISQWQGGCPLEPFIISEWVDKWNLDALKPWK